jgi:hypothetical protein
MPPKDSERLSEEQLKWLREWIAGGADWPNAKRIAEIAKANAETWSAEDGVMVTTSAGLSADWTNRKYKLDGLWAYQPRQDVSGRLQSPDVHPVDQLIDERMPHGLLSAPRADRQTLIRRATFDLTGLPPTPEEVSNFVADRRPDAVVFAELIEQLLQSPHYGEQMAQHWLDVVRYADSSGFANDSENPEMLVATGFLRMGPWELTGMEVAKVARQRFLDDVTNSVGETFLAHSLQCARCHDHKFDPVPTRDYYAIQAVFATTQLTERPASFLPRENTQGFDEMRFLEMRRDECIAKLRELDDALLENAQAWFRDHNLSPERISMESLIRPVLHLQSKSLPKINSRQSSSVSLRSSLETSVSRARDSNA